MAAVGTTRKAVMRGEHYDNGGTAAMRASCAIMGETVRRASRCWCSPQRRRCPSALFHGRTAPGRGYGALPHVLIYMRSRSRTGQDAAIQPAKSPGRGVTAMLALGAPDILIGGNVSGAATPTKVCSTAII
ncbi:hypothetical protein [Alsobacter sp. SYSU BS001988]